MHRNWLALIVSAFLVFADHSFAQEPIRLSASGISPSVWGVLEVPRAPESHPGLVILHGSAGWRAEYAHLARALADSGFVALALSHFVETGPDTSRARALQNWRTWQNTVRNAAAYLRALPATRGQKIGLIGFSHGAFLAISVASSIPEIGAVVDYYGGVNTRVSSLDDQLRNFPPLLVLHGDADTLVPVTRARILKDSIETRGGHVELHIYHGAQHAFNSRVYPSYSDSLTKDSNKVTIDFLRRHLVAK